MTESAIPIGAFTLRTTEAKLRFGLHLQKQGAMLILHAAHVTSRANFNAFFR